MRALFLTFVLASVTAQGIDFKKYHSQDEINGYLRSVAQENPSLVTFESLGKSDKGKEINFITLTHTNPSTAPAIHLNGTHHGNEKSSTETTLGIIDYLLAHQSEPEVKKLLDRYVVIVQPLVNPDGHAANTREDTNGRDPNRDYVYPGISSEGQAFKSVIIRHVRTLLERFKVHAAIAYHSGMEGVLWPWCAKSAPTEIKDKFQTLSKTAAQAMGMSYAVQSYFDYPSYGEYTDYAFLKYGTLGVTFEVSSAGNPSVSQLDSVVKRAVKGTFAYLDAVVALDEGRLRLEPAPRMEGLVPLNALFRALGRKVE